MDGASAGWDIVQPSRALDATWPLVRATNAHLEANEPWKPDPGPQVEAVLGRRARGAAHRRHPRRAGDPDTAQAIWDRIGLTGSSLDQRVPTDAAWGGYPGGLAVTKGAALFPRDHPMTAGWLDSHCHLPADDAADLVAEAARRRRVHDDHGRLRPGHIDRVARHRRALRRRLGHRGVAPSRGAYGVDTIHLFDGSVRPVAVGECGLDYHYDHSPRDAQREAFAAQSARPSSSTYRS